MQNLKNIVESTDRRDPLNLHKYVNNSQKQNHQKNIYFSVAAIFILGLIAFIFYCVAIVDGSIFGTPDSEIDAIISKKLAQIVDDDSIDINDESMSTHVGEKFDKIQVGLKIIPNMDQESFLLKRMSLVGDNYDGLESDVDYNDEVLKNRNEKFFEWTEAGHMTFPELKFDEQHVPVGDSVYYCMGLSWTTLRKRNQYDKYINF
jgi:hypothetical protein